MAGNKSLLSPFFYVVSNSRSQTKDTEITYMLTGNFLTEITRSAVGIRPTVIRCRLFSYQSQTQRPASGGNGAKKINYAE